MKLTFLNREEPHLVAMIQTPNENEAINVVRNSIYDGATAFGLQVESLQPEFQNTECIRRIMTHMGERRIEKCQFNLKRRIGKQSNELCFRYYLGGHKVENGNFQRTDILVHSADFVHNKYIFIFKYADGRKVSRHFNRHIIHLKKTLSSHYINYLQTYQEVFVNNNDHR